MLLAFSAGAGEFTNAECNSTQRQDHKSHLILSIHTSGADGNNSTDVEHDGGDDVAGGVLHPIPNLKGNRASAEAG